mgnify:CR=1 FL=1
MPSDDPHALLVGGDDDVVRESQVGPGIEMLAVRVEHLDAAVAAIGDVNASALGRLDAVQAAELSGTVALRAPQP